MGREGRLRLAATSADLRTAVRQVEGAAGRLAVQQASGLTADAWRATFSPEGSGLLTCLAVPETVDMDLRDWVRPQPASPFV